MHHYLIVHSLHAYRVHPDLISKGEYRRDKVWRGIRKNDRVLYYAKWDGHRNEGKKLVGVFKVSAEGRINPKGDPWKGGLGYPIEPVLIPQCPIDFSPRKFGLTHIKAANQITEQHYREVVLWMLGFEDLAPIYHETVVALFVKMHSSLGYPRIRLMQSGFPNCLAVDTKGKQARIEFEVKATDFDHKIEDCDKVICWEDDWGSTAPSSKIISLKEWIFG